MRLIALAAAVLISVAAEASAQDFRSGRSAYNIGDYATALRHWRSLAERNQAKAQSGLGFLYYKGLGVPQDSVEAARWFFRAAEQGAVEAQIFLGMMYLHGDGTSQSYVRAYLWCDLAVARGREEALACREEAFQNLTSDQLKRARRLVAHWYERRRND